MTGSIKDIVKGTTAQFTHYFDGDLWYNVEYGDNEVMVFPVPISDIGNATFKAEDKAMLFMRYIRKHMKTLEETFPSMWTKYADEKPIEGKDLWYYFEFTGVNIGQYFGDGTFGGLKGYLGDDVTHWQYATGQDKPEAPSE